MASASARSGASKASPLVKQLQRQRPGTSRSVLRSARSVASRPGTADGRSLLQRSARSGTLSRGPAHPLVSPIATKHGNPREVRAGLSRKLFANYHRMQDVFHSADPGGRGVVSYKDFKRALRAAGVKMPQQEFLRVLRLYDPADRGHVDYHDFNKRLGKLFSTTKSGEILVAPFSEQKRLGGLPPGPPQTPTLAGRLESTVAMQGVAGYERLSNALKQRSSNNTTISVQEFEAALKDAGIELTDQEERFILQKFCVAGGAIPLDLFATVMARDVRPQPKSRAPPRLVTARAVNRLFAHKMFTRFRTVKRAFRIFDEDHSGDVSHTEFRAGLATLGFHMSDEEFERFVLGYDKGNTGHVTYDMFNDAIGEFIQPRPTDGIFRRQERPTTPHLAEWVEPMFLQRALRLQRLGHHQLGEYFDHLDPYGAGAIAPARLVRAVRDEGGIEGDEAEYIVDQYPRDNRGRITKAGFLQRAEPLVKLPGRPSFDKRPEMYKVLRATTQTADDVERLFGNAMFSRYRTVLQAFRQFDEDHNGVVTRSEFRAALASMGFHMTDFEFDRFFRLFDVSGNNQINYQQFRETIGEVIQPTERRKHEVRPRAHQPNLIEWIMRNIKRVVEGGLVDVDAIESALMAQKDAAGNVTPAAVLDCLHRFHVELSHREEKLLLLGLDRDESGAIPASEMQRLIRTAVTLPPETKPAGYFSDDDDEDAHPTAAHGGSASRRNTSPSVAKLPRVSSAHKVEVPPLQAVAASRRPKSSMSSRSRLSGSMSATTTARERSAQIRMLETELHARSAAGQRLAATAKLSTIKSAYAAMKRDDKRKDGFLPVKLFKRHLKATSMSLNDEDFANLVSQYGDETGRYINYVEVMRQAFATRATHRSPSASRLQSARMLHSQQSRR